MACYAFCPGDQHYSLYQDIAARQKRCAVYDCIILTVYQCVYFYLHDEVQKSYIETAKQEEMKIQMSQYAKELEMMMKLQDRLNKIHHDYKHHLTTIGAMAKREEMKRFYRI